MLSCLSSRKRCLGEHTGCPQGACRVVWTPRVKTCGRDILIARVCDSLVCSCLCQSLTNVTKLL